MSGVVVIRYAGNISGPNVTDALLSTLTAKLERGRVEMDQHALPSRVVSLDIVYRPNLRLGQIVEVHDDLQGGMYRGKITSISHVSGPVATTTTIELTGFEGV